MAMNNEHMDEIIGKLYARNGIYSVNVVQVQGDKRYVIAGQIRMSEHDAIAYARSHGATRLVRM